MTPKKNKKTQPSPPDDLPTTLAEQSPESVIPAPPDMDQPSALTPPMDSSPASTPDQGVSSPPSTPPESSATSVESTPPVSSSTGRYHPIPPASEPMQYRAIGLIYGQYTPTDEQFTRGNLVTEDGTEINAVLLGRVMSLVKKHLDLEKPHLWVVYPRTREKNYDLHAQIVGVWEPENLAKGAGEGTSEDQTAETEASVESGLSEAAESGLSEAATPELDLKDGYFSIRGEVLFYSEEEERIIVRIQQAPKSGSQEEKSFKLILQGKLEGKNVGYFWDLHIQRDGKLLIVQDGTLIGLVPPRKRKSGDQKRRPGGDKRPWKGPQRGGPPRQRSGAPYQGGASERREPPSKPVKPIIKRQRDESSS